MANFEQWINQDLQDPVQVVYSQSLAFSSDNDSILVGVHVTDGGEPATLSGNVVAHVIRSADGGTVSFGGTLSGSDVSAVLRAACFAYPGQIAVMLQLVSGTTKTTLCKALYSVVQGETGTPIDPGSVVPDLDDLLAMLDEMAQATEAAESAAAAVPAIIAPTFSPSTPYTAGRYVYYNGALYRFTDDHAAGAWTGSDATSVQLAPEVADLKSAIIYHDVIQKLYDLSVSPKTYSTDIYASVMLEENKYYLIYNSAVTVNSSLIDIRTSKTAQDAIQQIRNYGEGGVNIDNPALFKFTGGESGVYVLHINVPSVLEVDSDTATKWVLDETTSKVVSWDFSQDAYGKPIKILGYITPQMFGAVANGTYDCKQAIQSAIDCANDVGIKEIVFQDGTYYVSNNSDTGVSLELKNNIIFRGVGKPKIVCNAAYSLAHSEEGYNVIFDGISVESASGSEITNAFFRLINEDVIGSAVKGSNVNTKGYGVLVEKGSDGGKHLLIEGNTILSQRDPVEINTVAPNGADNTYDRTGRFKDSIIKGNFLESDGGTDDTNYGFGVGIASGKNVVVGGNICDASKREGLHVENGSESTIVYGNIFDNCAENGARFFIDSASDEQPILLGNIFRHIGSVSTYAGLINPFNITSQRSSISAKANRFDNFAYGIQMANDSIIDADGCIIRNCSYALSLENADVHGVVIAEKCTQLIKSSGISKIDYISSISHTGANCIDKTNGTLIVRKGLRVTNVSTQNRSTSEYPTISFFKKPMYFDGFITVKFFSDNATGLRSFIVYKCKIEDGTLTKTEVVSSFASVYITVGNGVKINGDYLAYQLRLVYSQEFVLNAQIEMDGFIVF